MVATVVASLPLVQSRAIEARRCRDGWSRSARGPGASGPPRGGHLFLLAWRARHRLDGGSWSGEGHDRGLANLPEEVRGDGAELGYEAGHYRPAMEGH